MQRLPARAATLVLVCLHSVFRSLEPAKRSVQTAIIGLKADAARLGVCFTAILGPFRSLLTVLQKITV